ncbi:MAG: class I SAM-dependent methyltransferase [Pseudonocardiales bacterium]
MNQGHADLCSSPPWAAFIAADVLPAALAACGRARQARATGEILEIGPGYGAATARLRALGSRLTAVEIDPELAADLRERFPDVDVVDGSGEALPFGDSTFTAVFCFTMLHHVHTPTAQDALFAETRRVLRPGGVFAGSDSVAHPGLRAFHEGDTFTPVDPLTLADRLATAGLSDSTVQVASNEQWFAFSALAT